MDEGMSLQVDGLEDLAESLENIARRYPDRAAEILVNQAKELRKDVVRQVKNDTDTDGTSKKSLAKVGSYGISSVQGFGATQYVEVSAKSPHFHLLENGHMKVVPKSRAIKKPDGEKVKTTNPNGGQTVGFVPGYHFMDVASKKRQVKIPEEVAEEVEKLLEEEGLL